MSELGTKTPERTLPPSGWIAWSDGTCATERQVSPEQRATSTHIKATTSPKHSSRLWLSRLKAMAVLHYPGAVHILLLLIGNPEFLVTVLHPDFIDNAAELDW